MYILLAWRNIWRNKRRSLITMSSVMFAVMLAIVMKSMISGVWGKMINEVVSFSSGYIQIHKKGYWAEQSIDNSFKAQQDLINVIDQHNDILSWAPRLESFSLASSQDKTKGVLINGIDPERENKTTKLAQKLTQGNYLEHHDQSVMVAEGLAKQLKLNLNDTIVLLGQGYHGNLAAGKYSVKAIVHMGVVELNQSMVWMPLELCQAYFSAEQMLSSISLILADENKMNIIRSELEALPASKGYEIMTWSEMLPELDQMVKGDSTAHYLVIYILYLVISFGVFGTLLMMMNERMHEFGILLAIGMKKRIIIFITLTEVVIMACIGTLVGSFIALPLLLYLAKHPIKFTGELAKVYESFGMEAILPPAIETSIFITQAYTVFFIVILLSIYPAYKIYKLKIIKALNT